MNISYGEFLRWIGLWLLMSTIEGPSRRDFSPAPISLFGGAPFRLNNFMSRNRFESILEEVKYTDIEPPTYRDKFHSVRQLISEWNTNIQQNFIPGWISCIDESMSF